MSCVSLASRGLALAGGFVELDAVIGGGVTALGWTSMVSDAQLVSEIHSFT